MLIGLPDDRLPDDRLPDDRLREGCEKVVKKLEFPDDRLG